MVDPMPIELFDTHCHLTFKDLTGRCAQIIADAVRAGVSRMVTGVCTPAEIQAARESRRLYEQLWIAAGIHPHEAQRVNSDDLKTLAELWRTEPGIVAAGEMGLDYHYDFSPRDVQESVFRRQLDLAAETQLPIVIHCREAHKDVVRILSQHGYIGRRVVFHCFSGTPAEATELRANGWWTSFTGVVTFKNAAQMQQACVETPADEIMFETDAPYLSPEPVRHLRPNEPKHLVYTVQFAARLRDMTFKSLAETSTTNALRFFGLAN